MKKTEAESREGGAKHRKRDVPVIFPLNLSAAINNAL